jgi:hypothetical protein
VPWGARHRVARAVHGSVLPESLAVKLRNRFAR